MGSAYLHVILIVMVIQEDLVMVMKYLAGTYVQNNFFNFGQNNVKYFT